MVQKKSLSPVCRLAGLLFSGIALALSGAPAFAAPPIQIGGIFDLTSGPGGSWGVSERNGVTLAIEDFKSSHPNQEVALSVEDSGYDNAKSVSAVQKLASTQGLRFIIGPTWEPFDAVLPVCERQHLLCLAPSDGGPAFQQPGVRYSFSFWFDNRGYAAAHSQELLSGKYERVGMISTTTSYYELLSKEFQKMLGKRLVYTESVSPKDADLRSIALKVPKDLDALVVLLLADGNAEQFFRRWIELRADRPTIFTDDAVLYYAQPIDFSAQKFTLYYTQPLLDGFNTNEFDRRYEHRFSLAPGSPSAAIAYDATTLLLNCIYSQGSEVEKVRSCLASTKDYHGMSGKISLGGGQMVTERQMEVKRR